MLRTDISFEQISEAIDKLPLREKIKLSEKLQRQTWHQRLKVMFTKINSRRRKIPVSQKEIQKVIDDVREEIYERHRR